MGARVQKREREAERKAGRKEGSERGRRVQESVGRERGRSRASLASLRGETKNTRKFREPSASPSPRRRSPVEISLCPRGLLSLPSHSAFAQFALNRFAFSDTIRRDARRIGVASRLARSLIRSLGHSFDLSPLVPSSGTRITQPFRPWDPRLARSLARCSALVSGPTFSPPPPPLRLAIPTAFAAPSSTPRSSSSLEARNRVPRKRTRGCLRRWW